MRALLLVLLLTLATAPAAAAERLAQVPPGQLAAGPALAPGGAVWAAGGQRGPITLHLAGRRRARVFFALGAPAESPDPSITRVQTARIATSGRTVALARALTDQPLPPACHGPDPCALVAPPPALPFAVDLFAGRIGRPLTHVTRIRGGTECVRGEIPVSVSGDEIAWVAPSCKTTHRRCRVMVARSGARPHRLVPGCAVALSIAGPWVAWTTQRDGGPVSRVTLLDRRNGRRKAFDVFGAGPPVVAADGELALRGSICRRGRCARLGDTIVATKPAGRQAHDVPGSRFAEFIGFGRGRVLARAGANTPGQRCGGAGNALLGGWGGLKPVRSGRGCLAAEDGDWDGRRLAFARYGRSGEVAIGVRRVP